MVVEIDVEPDGTGSITVTATADRELAEQVPDLADQLVLDDIADAGWTVDGPNPTEDGGLTITFTHDFVDDKEATNLLLSLGPPFNGPALGRGVNGDTTTNSLSGRFGLQGRNGEPGGFDAFADDDLISAVGAVPFADEFAESGATPENSMSAVLRADLPGTILDDRTNGTVLPDGRLEWTIPMDGVTILELSAFSEQAPADGNEWARPVSIIALIALIAWVSFMGLFILFVFFARWRRARRYRRRNPPPIITG